MPEKKELFSHAASILPVENVAESIAFYTNMLGFDLKFTWNDPIEYAVLKRGEVSIHLTKKQDEQQPSKKHTRIYIFVHDVDALYQEFKERNVEIYHEIGNREWGMRDFDIIDAEGFILSFGNEIE